MAITALLYISVSLLLIGGAAIFFIKAMQSLMHHEPRGINLASNYPQPTNAAQFADEVIAAHREEIVAMLERQFRSSPSPDSPSS
ncbi:MAG: hypothetical protein ACK456_15750 [Pseudanabaenaceae cyanobacterium]|jgi:hypothetical protein